MEDFEDFNQDFENNLEEWRERMINSAIETNYRVISENGIDPFHLSTLSTKDMLSLLGTLKMMISHFEQAEQYERCHVLVKELHKVENILESTETDI